MELPVKSLYPTAILPKKAHDWDAGLDLYSIEARILHYKNIVGIRTGIAVAIPEGYFGLLAIRSSLGKKNIQLANAPGIVDSGYRGEIIVMLTILNKNFDYYRIERGEKIAQLVITPLPSITPVWTEELPPSDGRGEGGFGSSGKH
jgi:dUTP pyrophosphatase